MDYFEDDLIFTLVIGPLRVVGGGGGKGEREVGLLPFSIM